VTQHRDALLVAVMVATATAHVATQSEGPGLRRGQLTVSAGMIASGGYPLGDRNAEIRRNSTGTTAPFTLFRADSEIDGVRGVEARIALALTRTLAVEVGGTYGTPQLGVTITQDNEADPTTLVSERIEQYTVDVSGVFQLSGVKLGRRARPYVTGGGGYLRQLHAGRLLLETGTTIHLGGGIRYWLRGGLTPTRALGVRADARVVHRSGGVDFEDRSRTYPVFSLLGFVGF
jgi:hypothetical protein